MATSSAPVREVLPPLFVRPEDDSFGQSLWSATAVPAGDYPALEGGKRAQVAIVGAGYAGLSAAIALADRGIAAVVLDAVEPGYGASGRNGGQVIPVSKYEPDEMLARYGEQVGGDILSMVDATPEAVFSLVERFGIACEPNRSGWIQAAHAESAVPALRRRCEQFRARGCDVRWLDREPLAASLGTGHYAAGWMHRGAGSVQPLSYARGLARAAQSLGVQIHGSTLVRKLERQGGAWRLESARGEVIADRVVLATNAYTTGLWPGLPQSIVPLYSMQVATDPLPGTPEAGVLPAHCCVSDTRRVVRYFRKDAAGRLVIGTRGPFTPRPDAAHARALIRSARAMFPELAGVAFPYLWSGRVAMTTDSLPHLHNPAEGLWIALGCNGRGVGMATMLGKVLAAACAGAPDGAPRYPVTGIRRIPFHAFHRLGVHAMVTYYRLLDQLA